MRENYSFIVRDRKLIGVHKIRKDMKKTGAYCTLCRYAQDGIQYSAFIFSHALLTKARQIDKAQGGVDRGIAEIAECFSNDGSPHKLLRLEHPVGHKYLTDHINLVIQEIKGKAEEIHRMPWEHEEIRVEVSTWK